MVKPKKKTKSKKQALLEMRDAARAQSKEGIGMVVGSFPDQVVLVFSKPIDYMALSPAAASDLADKLLDKANGAEIIEEALNDQGLPIFVPKEK